MKRLVHTNYSRIGAMGVEERIMGICTGNMKDSQTRIRYIIFVLIVRWAFAFPKAKIQGTKNEF